MIVVGIDIGGTFTDAVLWDSSSGEMKISKVPTTTQDFSLGFEQAMVQIVSNFSEIDMILHGTTVGINAMLQGKLPKIGLLVTKGFGDQLDIQRTYKHWGKTYWSSPYDLQGDKPDPIVPRFLRREVNERVAYPGLVYRKLEDEDVISNVKDLMKVPELTGIAVTYLWSFMHPDHEIRTRELIKEAGFGGNVSLSYEVAPIYHEFERMVTTALNTSFMEIMDKYLSSLATRLSARGFRGLLSIMQCSGGMMSSDSAKKFPIYTIMSGPVGGVNASLYYSKLLSEPNLIGVDMGGTSFDVSTIIDGEIETVLEKEILHYPIRIPFVNVHSIGAGGGSIIWIDPTGSLQVGPDSAGANPGPACYGFGNRPTITDCNVVLNRLNPSRFLGGKMKLYPDRSKTALSEIAAKFGESEVKIAEDAVKVVNTNMMHAIMTMTVERGIDPSDFSIISFGGAGGLHTVEIGMELEVKSVIVPRNPSLFCALGLNLSDYRYISSATKRGVVQNTPPEEIEAAFNEQERKCLGVLQDVGFVEQDTSFIRTADMRYYLEEWEVPTPVPSRIKDTKSLIDSFVETKRKLYSTSRSVEELVEIVNYHVTAVGRRKDKLGIKTIEQGSTRPPDSAVLEERNIIVGGVEKKAAIYDRNFLLANNTLGGPAIVEETAHTLYIPPGAKGIVDKYGNIVIPIASRNRSL